MVYAGCQWGMLLGLGRLGGAELLGEYAFALAATTPVAVFTNLGLRDAQSSTANDTVSFSSFLRLRTITSASAMLIFLAISALADTHGALILAVALSKAIESLSDVCYGEFQRRQNLKLAGRSLIARGTIGLALFLTGLHWLHEIAAAVMLMAAWWLIMLFAHDLPAARGPRDQAEATNIWKLARRHVPLGIAALSTALYVNAPRYAIETFQDTVALGIFSAAWYLHVPGNVVVNSLSQTLTVRLAKAHNENNSGLFRSILQRSLLSVAALCTLAIIASIIAGSALLEFGYGHGFSRASNCLWIIMIGASIKWLATVVNSRLVATGAFLASARANVIGTAVTIASAFPLVYIFQIEGAAIALTAGSVVQLASLTTSRLPVHQTQHPADTAQPHPEHE